MQFSNAIVGLILAIVSSIARTKLNIDASYFLTKMLIFAPYTFSIIMAGNGILTYFYLDKAYDLVTGVPDSNENK